MRDNCARDSEQNNRIKQIHEGLARFIERCDPAHPTPARSFATPCEPKMSMPMTPLGVPSRYRSDFPFMSPVNQAAPTESACGNGGHDLSQRPAHEDEHGNSGDIQHSPTNNNSPSSSQYSTGQCPRNFDRGSYNSRPLRATNAGPWERGLYDW